MSGSDRDLVCIEAHGGPLLPISIAVTSDIINDIQHNPARILLGEGTLQISDRRVALNRWRADRISLTARPGGSGSLARAMRFSLALAPPPSESEALYERVAAFARALSQGHGADVGPATQGLIGLGFGSTPAGDDVVSAATATLRALLAATPSSKLSRHLLMMSSVISQQHEHTAPLSSALLRSAVDGHAIAALRRFVSAAAVEVDVADALAALMSVGGSSGYFLAAGATLAAEAISISEGSELSVA